MLDIAIEIASNAHLGQFDKQGKPYILHPLWVMDKVRHLGEDYMTVAVLHDLIEDTDWTIEKLRERGFHENILLALQLLDMRAGNYQANIEMILTNEYATQVKLRDLEHNSRITRLKKVDETDSTRLLKYHKAYKTLEPFRR